MNEKLQPDICEMPENGKPQPARNLVRALWNGEIIAESDQTIVIEGNHYFPVESVASAKLLASDTKTICGWKGEASYYSIRVGDSTNKDAAWYYAEPKEAAREIKGRIAFWRGVDVKVVD